jgi:hypothetical protein
VFTACHASLKLWIAMIQKGYFTACHAMLVAMPCLLEGFDANHKKRLLAY